MKYWVVIRHQAEKELGRLGHDERRRIGKKLLLLESDPFPAGVVALQGRPVIGFVSVIIGSSMSWMKLPKQRPLPLLVIEATSIAEADHRVAPRLAKA